MKNIHIVLSLIIFLFFGVAKAMESTDLKMVTINSWEDATPFEGKIVVYRNDHSIYPFAQCCAAYFLNYTRLRFGFIERLFTPQGIKAGYLLIQIVEKGTQGEHCPLTTYNVRNALMRLANEEEVLVLHWTIENKKDNFVVSWDQRTQLQLLEKQLGQKIKLL